MPKTHVTKKIEIDAKPSVIFPILNDFNHWTFWSPWLIMEPEAKVNVSEDSKYYDWEGNRIGSGNMKITSEAKNDRIEYDLNFLKPWKSYAKVTFLLKEKEDKTEVSWVMDSSLPFFLFFMKKGMEGFIGVDFDRGLRMLKEYVEDSKVKSKLEFIGKQKFDGLKYVGIKNTTGMAQLDEQMKADFERLERFIKDHQSYVDGAIFSQYHKWDIIKQRVDYTSGVGMKEIPSKLPDGFVAGEIPKTSVYTLRHIGSYAHLGNAWGTLNTMQRNKEFKNNKKIHPFEIYVNNPGETQDENLITDINFAVK